MEQPKPCPFCGSTDLSVPLDWSNLWIACGECEAMGPSTEVDQKASFKKEVDKVVAAWNKRTGGTDG